METPSRDKLCPDDVKEWASYHTLSGSVVSVIIISLPDCVPIVEVSGPKDPLWNSPDGALDCDYLPETPVDSLTTTAYTLCSVEEATTRLL